VVIDQVFAVGSDEEMPRYHIVGTTSAADRCFLLPAGNGIDIGYLVDIKTRCSEGGKENQLSIR
jgi:hypothetical protein